MNRWIAVVPLLALAGFGVSTPASAAGDWIVRDDFLVTRWNGHELSPGFNDTYVFEDMIDATYTIVDAPDHGTIETTQFGADRYFADPDFVGTDRLRYRICRTDGECRESDYTIEVVPLAGGSFGAQGAAGRERLEASNLPAMPSPRWRATPLVAAEWLRHETTPDLTPTTPWDSDDGVSFTLRTLAPVVGDPVAHRIDVMSFGHSNFLYQDIFVGVDTDGNGRPSEDEMLCTDGDHGNPECRIRLVVGATPVTYWVMTHNRLQVPAEADVSIYDVPLVDGDGSLTVTGPGIVGADRRADLLYAWEDRTMHLGEFRRGYLRIESDVGVPAGEVLVDVSNDNPDFRNADAIPLRAGVAELMALPGGFKHERIFIDVPAGATRLTITSEGGPADVDFYVARRTAALVAGAVSVDVAPPASEAVATSSGPGSDKSVVVEGPALAPGRWYVVPNVPGDDAATFSLKATVDAVAPVVRPGSYFNAGRPGSGLFLYPAGNQLTGLWYTYTDKDRPTWYYLQATAPDASGIWHSAIYRAAWDGGSRTLTAVGRATMTPTENDRFTFSYLLDGETGTQPFAALGRGCPAQGGMPVDISSQWFDPARAGTGYSVQAWDDYEYYAAYIYDSKGEAMFLAAELDHWGGEEATLVLQRLTGVSPTSRNSWYSARQDVGTLVRRLSGGSLNTIETDAVWPNGDGSTGTWSQADTVQTLGGAGSTQGCAP